MSKLKQRLSAAILVKTGLVVLPENIKPVVHRSCTTNRVWFRTQCGRDICSEQTITELCANLSTLVLDSGNFWVG